MLNNGLWILFIISLLILNVYISIDSRIESRSSDFVVINDNRYHRDSIVEFSSQYDEDNKEFLFIVVESEIGKICFEYFPEENQDLEAWKKGFLNNFE